MLNWHRSIIVLQYILFKISTVLILLSCTNMNAFILKSDWFFFLSIHRILLGNITNILVCVIECWQSHIAFRMSLSTANITWLLQVNISTRTYQIICILQIYCISSTRKLILCLILVLRFLVFLIFGSLRTQLHHLR